MPRSKYDHDTKRFGTTGKAKVQRYRCREPLGLGRTSRALAIGHIAMFDAVNAID